MTEADILTAVALLKARDAVAELLDDLGPGGSFTAGPLSIVLSDDDGSTTAAQEFIIFGLSHISEVIKRRLIDLGVEK